MRKSIIISVCLILLLSSIPLSVGQNQQYQKQTFVFTFSPPVFALSNKISLFNIPEASDLFIKNSYYMQPMKTEKIYFPLGTIIKDISCIPSTIHSIATANPFQVSPVPVLASTGQPLEKEEACELQTIDTWYDFDVGRGIVGTEQQVILSLQLYPMLYDQEQSELSWVEQIEVTVTIKEDSWQTNQIPSDSGYELLIISPESYQEDLMDLVNHKISRNISTKSVTLEEIVSGVYFSPTGRDVQEQIKYFIKRAIEQWGTSYVLLVGGSASIPIRETHIKVSSGDFEIFASDLYYADIYNETGVFSSWDTNNNDLFAEYNWGDAKDSDDLDLYPDIYLGRLACISETEVQTVVQKIITYETTQAYTTDWFTNIITVGGDSFTEEYGDDTGTNEGELVNEYVIDIMDGFIPIRLWSSNGKLGGVSPTGVAEIESAFQTGAGFVDFSGHGNTYVYATHHTNGSAWIPTPTGGLHNTQVAQFNNGEKLPIVITGACSVGKFNKDSDCFSWSFVSSPNGGGIASCGSTALGYAYIGKWVTRGLVEKMVINMFDAYSNGAMTFGEMWADAVSAYISSRMEGADYKTVMEWEAFGDPTLSLGEPSTPPLKPDAPTGPEKGHVKDTIVFSASTTDPEGDSLYYLFEWGNDAYSGWIGPFDSGETAEASYTWDKRGEYQVRVKAKDSHGKQSEWSDPVPISMPQRTMVLDVFFEKMIQRGWFSQRNRNSILEILLGNMDVLVGTKTLWLKETFI